MKIDLSNYDFGASVFDVTVDRIATFRTETINDAMQQYQEILKQNQHPVYGTACLPNARVVTDAGDVFFLFVNGEVFKPAC